MAVAKKTGKKTKRPAATSKKTRDDRIFNYVLLGLGVLFILGVVFSLLIRGGNSSNNNMNNMPGMTGTTSTNPNDHPGSLQAELSSGELGKKLANYGFEQPTYDPTKNQEFMVVANSSFLRLSRDEQEKKMNEIGNNWAALVKKHLGDNQYAYIMFHDTPNTMLATWTPQGGVQFMK